jgi:hypothetical protein
LAFYLNIWAALLLAFANFCFRRAIRLSRSRRVRPFVFMGLTASSVHRRHFGERPVQAIGSHRA